MEVVNALLSAAFLILVAVSAAVTGSMVLLGLFDYAFRKKKGPEPSPESPGDERPADGHSEDDALEFEEELHAAQMKKFGTR